MGKDALFTICALAGSEVTTHGLRLPGRGSFSLSVLLSIIGSSCFLTAISRDVAVAAILAFALAQRPELTGFLLAVLIVRG